MFSTIIHFPFPCLPLLFILFLALTFRYLKIKKKNGDKKKSGIKTKFPPKLPIIGNLHQLGKLPHQNFYKFSQEYGPAMLLQLGTTPALIISSANLAKQVLKTHDIDLCSRPRSPGAKRILYDFLDVAFTPYGDHWRNTRKIFVYHLLSSKRVQSFSSARDTEINDLIDFLSTASTNSVNLDEKIFDFVDGVIGTVAFGKSYRGKQFEGQVLKDVMCEAMDMINSFAAEDFFPFFGWIVDFLSGHQAKVDKCFYKLDGYLETVLNEHFNREMKKEDDDEDLVDVLIGLLNDERSAVSSKKHIKAILMNTFLGGVDTSAIAIVWAMCELIRNPRVMQKAQSEIRGNLGVKPKVEGDDLSKFQYLKMLVKETLRLHPPAPLLLPRESMRECQIHGEAEEVYNIYPKTRVVINAWAIGRDPKSWKNPNEFYPERFEESDLDLRGHHVEFVPFGGGRRICPGISTSITTIEFTLANLLYWFDWKVPNNMKVEDIVSLEEEGGVTVHKRTHLTLVPIKHAWP